MRSNQISLDPNPQYLNFEIVSICSGCVIFQFLDFTTVKFILSSCLILNLSLIPNHYEFYWVPNPLESPFQRLGYIDLTFHWASQDIYKTRIINLEAGKTPKLIACPI